MNEAWSLDNKQEVVINNCNDNDSDKPKNVKLPK